MDEYTIELHMLVARVDLAEGEEQQVSGYIGDMIQQFQDSLNLFDPKALHLEKTMSHKPLGLFGGRGGNNNSRSIIPPAVLQNGLN
jgi:hypothetical protein